LSGMEIDIRDSFYQEKHKITQALFEVVDPELSINIIDLGLVYSIQIEENAKRIVINMTLSTPSCPMGGLISNHVKIAVEAAMPGYNTIVELVWEPKWNADKISDSGRTQLGW